jgi:hypothetical protein
VTGPDCTGGDLPSDTGSPWMSVLMVRRAIAVTQRWNARFPNAQVCIEWSEEAAYALEAARAAGPTAEGLEWQRRAMEFLDRLPVQLVEAIFGGRELPEELP